MINLYTLNLSYNKISKLPLEIINLNTLRMLHLSHNQFSEIPSEILKLENLVVLGLSELNLASISPEIEKLQKLKKLYLNGNKITTLPPEIFKLKNLELLHLSDNKLKKLSSEIIKLVSLRKLYLYNNRLKTLPSEIRKIRGLDYFDIRKNPLDIEIPPEILEKTNSPQTILNYYFEHKRALEEGNTRPLNEAKLILVGQGGVGKTSLVNRLIRDKFNPDETKTPGIDINRWKINTNGDEIKLNIWDFGGQEIMHATHQFFLTNRTIYILVLDSRIGEKGSQAEYWLKLIKSYGANSPVIIVCNKCDEHIIDLNRIDLNKTYDNIREYAMQISCKTGEGISEVKELIRRQTEKLEHIHNRLSINWLDVKQELEDMKDNLHLDFIPYNLYEEICEENEIFDEQSRRTLLQFLHDLGIVLCFQDDPRLEFTHVLNPLWVTQGIYKILNSNELFRNKGILKIDLLHKILDELNNSEQYKSDENESQFFKKALKKFKSLLGIQKQTRKGEKCRYPRDKHIFIIDMMKKFELCFELEGTKNTRFLIPDLLPINEPYTGEWNNSLEFQYHYDILPGSVISRFIVRRHRDIHKNTYWRTGVVIKKNGNKALIKGDEIQKKISIYIDGDEHSRRDLLTMIRVEFESIHHTIPGIKVVEKVPVPEFPDVPPVDYKNLLVHKEKGQEEFIPEGAIDKINVLKMLNRIEKEETTMLHIEKLMVFQKGAECTMGDKLKFENIKIEGNTGQVALGKDINQTMTQTTNKTVNHIKKLKEAVKEIDEEKLPEEDKSWTLEQLDLAIKKAEEKKPNNKFIARYIKEAVDTVTSGGVLVTATSKVGQILIPLAEKLGKTAAFFGL